MLTDSSIVAALGGVFYSIRGATHAFSLSDRNISYPLYPDTVSITVVAIVALVIPAILIAAFSLLFPLASRHSASASTSTSTSTSTPPSSTWRLKLWNWHSGWLGLGLSLAGAFLVTSALKDVVGQPRPNLLARCQPDVAQIATYAVGGLGRYLPEAPILVTAGICTNPDKSVVQDGFQAWPSGHSSFSFAGLLYLTLWLAGRVGVAVPSGIAGSSGLWAGPRERSGSQHRVARGAAPPVWLLVAALIPVGAAAYIAASRWADNQHSGWDILAGSAIGVGFAWLGYRWYHPPLQNLTGGAWGPRFGGRAFYGGIGYSDSDEAERRHDEEGATLETV